MRTLSPALLAATILAQSDGPLGNPLQLPGRRAKRDYAPRTDVPAGQYRLELAGLTRSQRKRICKQNGWPMWA